jgi:hypothetical protein
MQRLGNHAAKEVGKKGKASARASLAVKKK